MPITNAQLLESLTEAIRNRRRHGPRFPTAFDCSYINFDVVNNRIELDLMEDGKVVKYDLLLDRVSYHGESSIPQIIEDNAVVEAKENE